MELEDNIDDDEERPNPRGKYMRQLVSIPSSTTLA